jgi:cellulose synthase/poly-beta-1,6-N-acetylglucosamine synthase-like glycosyltransferase
MAGWIDRIGFLGATTTVLAFGFLQGIQVLTINLVVLAVAIEVVFLQAILASASFTAFLGGSGLLLAANLLRADSRAPEPPDGATLSAIVPVYQDAPILHRSVESLVEAGPDVSVTVVTEPDDAASIERARALATAYDAVSHCVNTSAPGSKAGAIAHAIETAVGADDPTSRDRPATPAAIGVFDADERVDPAFLDRALARIAGGQADVVQGRTIPEPTGIIESIAYYESVLLSYAGRRLLYLLTDFRMAASRSVVFSPVAYRRSGGYDETMLTEDFDFAYRCYKTGLDVEECLAHPSRIEAAHSLTDWWGQRKRWMTGYAQVLARQLRGVLPPRRFRDLSAVAICASTVLGSVLMLTVLSKFLVLFLVAPRVVSLAPVTVAIGVALTLRSIDAWRGHVDGVGWTWLLVPLVFPIYSLAAIKAVIEYPFTWDGEWYRVEKGGAAGAED